MAWACMAANGTESLLLKHIWIVSFKIHCAGVPRQNDENVVNVQIFMDLTMYIHIMKYEKSCMETAKTDRKLSSTAHIF